MSKKNLTTGNMALNKYRASVDSIFEGTLDDNYYAGLLFDLFETTYLPEYETVKTWKRHFGKPFKVNIKQYDAIQRINKKIDILKSESPSFDDMFEFGTFIKILEKVFMYKNDKDAKFVCDSNIDDMKHRVLVIQCDDCFIKFSLVKQTDGTPNTIDIYIERLYGKNMKTSYHIENRESNAKDSTDVMLINNITMLLKEKMAKLLAFYGNVVVNKKIEDAVQGKLSVPNFYTSYVQRDDIYYSWDWCGDEGAKEWFKDLKWYLKHVYK